MSPTGIDFSDATMTAMDQYAGKHFQFSLKSAFVAVLGAAVVASAFHYLETDAALAGIIIAILFAPIAYYTDWLEALRTLAWIALLMAVFYAGCVSYYPFPD